VNAFDYSLLLYLNHLADQSPVFTKVIVAIYDDDLKSALVAALLWWAWFGAGGTTREAETRARIVAGFCGSILCIVGVRVLAAVLPFREQPISNDAIGLHFPIAPEGWGNWSAFPSDNAVLFFCLTIAKPALRWMRAHPASFYAAAFLVSFLIAEVFWPALRILRGIGKLAVAAR
jgi:hypothetical protein